VKTRKAGSDESQAPSILTCPRGSKPPSRQKALQRRETGVHLRAPDPRTVQHSSYLLDGERADADATTATDSEHPADRIRLTRMPSGGIREGKSYSLEFPFTMVRVSAECRGPAVAGCGSERRASRPAGQETGGPCPARVSFVRPEASPTKAHSGRTRRQSRKSGCTRRHRLVSC